MSIGLRVDMDGMAMTVTGIEPGSGVTKAGIIAHLAPLNHYQAGINWCVGDLLILGGREFGDHWIEQTVAEYMQAMSPETLRQCRWVSERYPYHQRVNRLTWSHHLIAAGVEDERSRTKLLESCLEPAADAPGRGPESPMSTSDLRRAVKCLKDGEDEDEGAKLLEAAKRAIAKLGPSERDTLFRWLGSKWDEWERIDGV